MNGFFKDSYTYTHVPTALISLTFIAYMSSKATEWSYATFERASRDPRQPSVMCQ